MLDRIKCFFIILLLFSYGNCQEEYQLRGRINATMKDQRIVGGIEATKGAYPWLVQLFPDESWSEYYPNCQGSLITPQIVLTAAHCIDMSISATTGNHDLIRDRPSEIEAFQIKEKIKHPGYVASTYKYDFGLILLNRPHPNPTLASIRRSPEIPNVMKIMGFGATSQGGLQPNVLQEATVERVPSKICIQNYAFGGMDVEDDMFCAADSGIDSCQGDSGGPIVREGTNIQVGIVSWGVGCANPRFPGVYAKVYSAFDWINEIACEWTDSCTNNQIDMVNAEGKAIKRAGSCRDLDGEFRGLGKKGKQRTCDWVKGRLGSRCKWYGDLYCPATCNIERCR